MKLSEIIKNLNLEKISCNLDPDVTGGYTGDLLSDVMGNGTKGDIWITRQVHVNIVAVASLKDLAGIIIVEGAKPDDMAVEKAKQQNIPLLSCPMKAFEVSGKIYNLLNR